ncbi:Imm50 family immunity protein [Kitasatospora sp. NPDC093558]|uniref:Imm50 family immunity protein n=1 Tax=Kitasatospora sp. NPDC093558 TaxID=3155201 RepID=UPI0034265BBD
MPADAWPELLVGSERLTALYTELPLLERLVLRSVHLNPRGAGVTLRVEFPRFPDLAPQAWTDAGCDRFEAQVEFMGVEEDLRMRGVPVATVVDVELSRFMRDRERRIAVGVRGPGFSLDFTAHAAIEAGHLNAYRSGDAEPYAARRWFVSPLDRRLYGTELPPTTAKVFYERP